MDEEQIEQCRRKAIGMLRSYNDNKVQIEMLQSKLREASSRTDVGSMAVSYDQPSGGQTNKVSSVVESAIVSKEREIEQLSNELAYYRGQVERIDIALDNMPYAQRTLLKLKYVECQYWQEVAEAIGYDVYYTKKELKQSAVDMLTGYLFPELCMVNLFSGGEMIK